MSESGRTCRNVDRRGKLSEEPFDVQIARDKVIVRFRGRIVRTLTGPDVDAVRAVLDDPEKLQLLVARKTGNFKRGNERR
ncbi:MAG TPA: hypothetical protein VL326_15915 [Kofleriaceae bacterium]|nr:hypothetical protein [Kofleriaceae bacterium]